jgi:two-component system, NarL family, response regulator LiaR
MPERPTQPVLIADGHRLFRTTLRAALTARGLDAHELPLADRDALLAEAAGFDTAVVVLDLSLEQHLSVGPPAGLPADTGERPGLVAALHVLGHRPVVIRGGHDEPAMAAAVAGGAVGSVTRSTPFEHLLRLVLRAAAGDPVMTGVERNHWLSRHRHLRDRQLRFTGLTERLTTREREILGLLAEGHGAAAIATRSELPEDAVRAEIRAILATLEVSSQLEAAVLMRDDPARHHILDGLPGAPRRSPVDRRVIR